MLWVCFNSWTFMLAELLAKLLAGCCNSPWLADWQAIASAYKTQRASRKLAKLHVILAKERKDCWLMPVSTASLPFNSKTTTCLPTPPRDDFVGSPDLNKQSLVLLD